LSHVQIFTSYDVEHDADLHDALLTQSRSRYSRFEILGGSEGGEMTPRWEAKVRRRIQQADEVIVICGEHTEASKRVSAELRIAREERKAYVLLWGRRESMCTKPIGARPDDGIYKWTWDILQDQLTSRLRNARSLQVAARYKRD